MPYEIEDKSVTRNGNNIRYPFGKMEVGQSFVLNKADWDRVSRAAYAYAKTNKKKFSVVREGDGYRCGRTA